MLGALLEIHSSLKCIMNTIGVGAESYDNSLVIGKGVLTGMMNNCPLEFAVDKLLIRSISYNSQLKHWTIVFDRTGTGWDHLSFIVYEVGADYMDASSGGSKIGTISDLKRKLCSVVGESHW
jgi:hypothetical protein